MNNKKQLIDIVVDLGADNTGNTEVTDIIQYALTNYKAIHIPDGTFLVDPVTMLNVPSNRKITLSNFAIIKAKPTSNSTYKILNLLNVENVEITGGTIQGERNEHLGITGEHGIGINIKGCKNITIRETVIKDCWGDGIYIGSGIKKYSENVKIIDIECDNNRRQGISVISVKMLKIIRPKVTNTNGTDPQCGIDIEPNSVDGLLEGILIIDPYTQNNVNQGIIIGLSKFGGSGKNIDITIQNHVDRGSACGFSVSSTSGGFGGKINLINPYYENNKQQGISIRDYDVSGAVINIVKPTVINPNSFNNSAPQYASGIVIYKETTDTRALNIGNVFIDEPNVVDNRQTPLMEYSVFVRDLTGKTGKKIKVSNPVKLSLTLPFAFYSEAVVIDLFESSRYEPSNGYTVRNQNYRRDISNKNFTTLSTFTLSDDIFINHPQMTFIVENSVGLRIQPQSFSTIAPLSEVNGKYIQSTQKGARVTIKRMDDTTWVITEMIGLWTVQA
ncbi:hypothetical protein LHV56_18390 [Peribacillus frigoritolerans]|uniref:hypothetical protein n=1 Tax=Peribacillus frigoritolerans TaxID=450367 RepID=UPI00207ABDA9|nr:hypothetical protein [Peribacillus frigoritolerans]USK78813.1 hypothetical protein LHV56_18390 [Peribacillus frigoritolerans]